MGCDIHAHLEVRRYTYDDDKRENGIWINADKWTVNEDHIKYPEDYNRRFHVDYEDRIYKGRNYCLFAILANVRNYWDIKPISEPKGLPDDVSLETKHESDDYGVDGHSHTYLTLEELLNYDGWDIPEEGTEFAFDEDRLAKVRSELGAKFIKTEKGGIGYKVYYHTSIKELCSEFYEGTINKLKSYLKEHDIPKYQVRPDDVRVVFWFDN